MPDLDFRFDEITEEYSRRQLDEVRNFVHAHELPPDLMLEIGTNRGRFLRQLAEQNPDAGVLGVELRHKYVKLARRDLKKAGLDNAHVVCADANLLLPIAIDDGQLTDVFVLYPDPWWKKRHRKRRIIQPEFLDLLARKMRAGGTLWIRTDVGPLADDMRDTLVDHPAFTPLDPADYPTEPFLRSTRERTSIKQDLPVNILYFRRCGDS